MVAKLTEQVSIGVYHIDKYSSHSYSLHHTYVHYIWLPT